MNTFKNHLSLIFALVTLLASFQFFSSFADMVDRYEASLSSEYAIIAISKEPLELEAVLERIPYASTLEPIDPGFVIEEVRESVSPDNLSYLKTALPHFYRIRLNHFPSIEDRIHIEQTLSNLESVIRVETFAKTQNKVYRLLLLNRGIFFTFAALMFLVAFLLIVRQMEVWRYEHSERMRIMTIFGAPLWMRSAVLYRLAFIDSLVSSVLVGGLFYYLSADSYLVKALSEIGLPTVLFDPVADGGRLLVLSLFISVSSVAYVIIKADKTA
jgi:cell division transport system permease protein